MPSQSKRRAEQATPPIPLDAYVSRRAGTIGERAGEVVVLTTRRRKVRLNSTALVVWELCDGQRRTTEIAELLAAHYPQASDQVRQEVVATLNELNRSKVLRVGPTRDPQRPLLRVAFANVWRGFDVRNNYFLKALAHRFDVLLVDPSVEPPNVLFFSGDPPGGFDHRHADRSTTLKIYFANAKSQPDYGECDFAFSPDPPEPRFADRHVRLPFWSLFLDWDRVRAAVSSVLDGHIPYELRPAVIGDRLFDFIVGEAPSESGPTVAVTPAAPRPAVPAASYASADTGDSDRKLTIGMATYDDYDGAYFTVQAVRLYHPEVADEIEFVVVDNDPDGPAAQPLRDLGRGSPHYRYVANRERQGTATRDLVFREARTPYVVCVDSHVLIAPGAIRRLIDYLDARPACGDLLQGPLVYDDQASIATHFAPIWSGGMYGTWATDERALDRDAEPFDIPMQGLGLFACRRDAWLGFNPRFTGFGGEEGYIHAKFRRAGHRTLCLPFLRWNHRFQRPHGIRYPNIWQERIRNYVVGWTELGEDTGALEAHFRHELGADGFEQGMALIRAELDGPFHYFDAIYCINLDSAIDRWEAMQARFRRLGILHRVRRFSAVETPESHHVGCALSHRRILEQARKEGLSNVLVFEDDALVHDDATAILKSGVEDLRVLPWSVFHLGGHRYKTSASVSPALERCPDLTTTEAVAYNSPIFDHLLEVLPAGREQMRLWLAREAGIDQYLRNVEPRYVVRPPVTTQKARLPEEAEPHRFT